MNLFEQATGGKSYEILESYNLISDYGTVYIFKDENKNYFIGEELFPDRGAPRDIWFKIDKKDYELYLNPNKKEIINLLQKRFFNSTLFDVFLKRDDNLELMKSLVEEVGSLRLDNHSVQSWFGVQRSEKLNNNHPSSLLGTIDFPGFLSGLKFVSFEILEIDVRILNEAERRYDYFRYVVDVKSMKVISNAKIIEDDKAHPLFQVGEAYPIKDAHFGNDFQYTAKAPPTLPPFVESQMTIYENDHPIFKFNYPGSALLGRFVTCLAPSADENYLNSVIFMYPIRDHDYHETCYLFRFEVKDGRVTEKNVLTSECTSSIAFNSAGLMATGYLSEGRNRPYGVQIYRL